MGALDIEHVLREETKVIHGDDAARKVAGKAGADLYRELNGLNSTALCLSGGGIRSASFALGVIEALATHPRQASVPQEADKQSDAAGKSLLAQFHYLSTVSGGGYMGSWLSAWIARAGYPAVWRRLIGERDHPEMEPSEIAWLRAYSNYLTPRRGLFSADTWSAIALYVRNLILNWLVILPALCLALLAIKAFAAGTFSLSGVGGYAPAAFVILGVVAMIWSLRFALRNRPSCNASAAGAAAKAPERSTASGDRAGMRDPHHNEAAHARPGLDEGGFLRRCLLPALAAALLLSLYLMIRAPVLADWQLWSTVLLALLTGMAVYAFAWILAFPPATCLPYRGETRGSVYWLRDFTSWVAAGGVYGAIIGVGIHMVAKFDLGLLIGNVSVPKATGNFLIALVYGVPWIITAQLTAEMIFVGLTNWQRFSDADREWFGRSTGWFTVAAFMWFSMTFLVLIAGHLAWGLVATYDAAKYGTSLLTIASGLFTTLAGKSGRSPAKDQTESKSGRWMRIALPLGAIIFLILLVLAVSALIDYLLLDRSLLDSSLLGIGPASSWRGEWKWLGIGFAVIAFVAVMSWAHVNINRFSIHALYRNRLIRAYLGASNPHRAPNPFTGFDEADNLPMSQLRPLAKTHGRLFHVVNIALNVVNSNRLAWQERKAEPFTMTPLHCGTASNGLGYRPSAEYGDNDRGGISLGTALAISGAAASPNMGYHSSPLVGLLLALFNVRLGWWLGNPGPKGDRTYQTDGPMVAIAPFIEEMFGLTTDDRRYVYLSDGGHFENLGLYEMVRRRCRHIVISDAGCDPDYGFEDLGNAVRKIAIDLGIYITFGKLHELKKRSKDNAVITGAYYAIGEIDYKAAPEGDAGAENGYILYIKPGYHGTESAGIVAYATANAAFPHEPTADQFFSESQFESYRTLGFEIMDGVLANAIENAEMIARAGKGSPSAECLCDLIRALDPKLIKDAEDAFRTSQPTASETIKSLDEGALKVLRSVFRGSQEADAKA